MSYAHKHHTGGFDSSVAHLTYEQMLQINFDLTQKTTKKLIDSIGIQSDWNILDVGSGTGLLSSLFLDKISSGTGTLTLMEPSDSFEGHMTALVDKHPGKVLYKRSMIDDSNYACEKSPKGYDLIFIRLVLHHLKADKALDTLLEYLRPGGSLAIQEFVHGTGAFWTRGAVCEALHKLELNSVKEIRTHTLGEDFSEYVPPPLYKNLLSKKCDIAVYDKFIMEDHPKSTLGVAAYKMMTVHCGDPQLAEQAEKEYATACGDQDSVVYYRTQIHIVATKK